MESKPFGVKSLSSALDDSSLPQNGSLVVAPFDGDTLFMPSSTVGLTTTGKGGSESLSLCFVVGYFHIASGNTVCWLHCGGQSFLSANILVLTANSC